MRSEMGEGRHELLLAISIVAHDEANKHLSEGGRDVLEMMEYTSRNSGLSIAEKDSDPAWSPNGEKIVFDSRRGGSD